MEFESMGSEVLSKKELLHEYLLRKAWERQNLGACEIGLEEKTTRVEAGDFEPFVHQGDPLKKLKAYRYVKPDAQTPKYRHKLSQYK